MIDTPLVSVIMPVYNGADTIDMAIKSLLFQTYTNWKCIIVDDGSIDETRKILLKYESDKRFKIIYLEQNKGRGYARQIALNNVEGEYIAYLDADDFYHKNKIEVQLEILHNNKDISLISTGLASYDDQKTLRTVQVSNSESVMTYDNKNKLKISCATSMLRASKVSNIRYNLRLKSSEDIDFFERVMINKKYIVIDRILYYYSEYNSVTKRKIIDYAFIALKNSFFKVNFNKTYTIKSFILSFLRIFYYLLFLPFVDVPFFVNRRRGKRKPTYEEIIDFDKMKKEIINL